MNHNPAPAVVWFVPRAGRGRVAVYVSSRRITARCAGCVLAALFIRRHTARAVVISGNARTAARLLHDPRYPPVLVVPLPLTVRGRVLLSVLRQTDVLPAG